MIDAVVENAAMAISAEMFGTTDYTWNTTVIDEHKNKMRAIARRLIPLLGCSRPTPRSSICAQADQADLFT